MKTIYLIRHAKSDLDGHNLTDINRVLNQKGITDAQLMGDKLKELNYHPELIVCSTALRALITLEIITSQTDNIKTNTIFDSSIYEGTLEYLIFLTNMLPNVYSDITIIGHNPGLTLLSNYLTDDFIDYIPTCGIVKIEFDIANWNEIVKGMGSKKYFIYPKAFVTI